MGLRGPEALSVDVKRLRGTLEKGRERARGNDPSEGTSEAGELQDIEVSDRDYVAIADGYVEDVLAGRIVSCQWVQKAVRRFQKMRGKAEGPDRPYLFSPEHATKVCEFAERCPHVEGRWEKDTIVLHPFQVFILVACYGFRTHEDRRLVTVVFFEVARKSAKSTLVAVAGLFHLAEEKEPGAQVVCGATTGQQARIVFGIMQKMIRKSPWLRSLGLVVFANAITLEEIGGNVRPINSKSSTQDGLNPSFISLDESHAQTFELRDVLMSAMGARPDGMIWCPTTAGYDLTSVGHALRTTAMKVLDGVIESDHTFCVLYELDEADDWKDSTAWIKAAPMIGTTPTMEYVLRYCADAQQTPGMQGEFETKVCNRWLHSASRWLQIDAWDKCADPELKIEDFAFDKCWIGVDLAERDDISAVVLNFRDEDRIVSFVRGYLPEKVVAERVRAVPEYRAWLQTGELELNPGDMTDYGAIESYLRECCKTYDVKAIVIERYGALHLAANLCEDGLPARIESKNVKVFTPPAKELEARIKAKRFVHAGSSFLRWQASNACAERRRDGSLLPTKDSPESPNKIDAIDALLLGWSALLADSTQEREPQMFVLGSGAR
jgi:phage terminase large subunit-like protein